MILTLFPTAYPFLLCYGWVGGGVKFPLAKNTLKGPEGVFPE